MRSILALLLVAAGTAAAQVEIVSVDAPERTVAGKAFNASVELRNAGEARVVYLFGALYEGEGDGCGSAGDPRFRGYTETFVEPVKLPAGATLRYPEPGGRWQHRYDPEDVRDARATDEWCVFVAEDEAPPRLRWLDHASVPLATRRVNEPPEPTVGWSPQAPRAAIDARFEATATDPDGDPVTFRWDFGHANATGRAVAEGPVAYHPFYPEGVYTVTLVASDGLDEARVAREVVVLPEDAPPPTPSPVAQTPRDTPGAPLGLVLLGVGALALRRRWR